MRLTLRTLLAYLDDTLDPVQSRTIGQKVAESDVARELVEKLRKVVRKRGISAPPISGADAASANRVAEYLDNDLDDARVTELEEQALGSEMLLAEIAACHQLLTIILSEPAKVPPTARQRMYGLISGPEVDPNRKAPRVASATLHSSQPGTSEYDIHPLVSHQGGKQRLVIAAVLAPLLALAVWGVMSVRPPAPRPADVPVVEVKQPPPPQPAKEVAKEPEPQPKIVEPQPKMVEPQPKAPEPQPKTPDNPPPPPAPVVDMANERKTSDDRADVGKFAAGGVLLQSVYDGAPWQKAAMGGAVTGASRLMSLPGLSAEVRLGDAVSLDLVGMVIDFIGNTPQGPFPELESLASVYVPPSGFDADVRLERGRVFVKSPRPAGAKVRLRLRDDFFDVTLPDDKTEVLVELAAVYAGEPFSREVDKAVPPTARGAMCVTQGKATVRINMGAETPMAAPSVINWDAKNGAAPVKELPEPPPVWAKQPPLPIGPGRDAAMALQAMLKTVPKLFADPKKDLTTSIAELNLEKPPFGRMLAVYYREATDDLPGIVDALEDAGAGEARTAATFALVQWLGRGGPAHDAKLVKLLRDRGFNEIQAAGLMSILHGPSPEQVQDPKTYAELIDNLKDDRLAVRELSLWRLTQLDPDAKIPGNAADPADRRKQMFDAWKKRLADGKTPAGRGK